MNSTNGTRGFPGVRRLELLDAYHDDGVMAAHAHTLRPLLAGMPKPNPFAEPHLGILTVATGRPRGAFAVLL